MDSTSNEQKIELKNVLENLDLVESSKHLTKRGRPKGQNISSFGSEHPCQYCSNSYRENSTLNSHIRTNHKDKHNSKLVGRPKGHRGSSGVQYSCHLCFYSYKNKHALQSHLRGIHNNRLTFSSISSSGTSSSSENRPNGQGCDSNGESEYSCEYRNCDRKFLSELGKLIHEAAHKRKLIKIKNEIKEEEDIIIIGNFPPVVNEGWKSSVNRNINMDCSPSVTSNVENSYMPLSAAIFSRAGENPREMMVIWCNRLEDDILSAVTLNKRNTILCIQNLDFFDASNQQKNMVKNGDMTRFIIIDDSGAFSQWTAITFDFKIPSFGIKDKSFKSYAEAEKIFSEHAGSHGMNIVNMMRYNEDGFYRIPSQKLTKKVLLCNYSE